MDLPGANFLLEYGPLGLMTLVSLAAVVALWRSLKCCQSEQRRLVNETIERQLGTMQEAIEREERRAGEYEELLLKLERALKLLAERVGVERVDVEN